MILSIRKAYLILILWALSLTAVSIILNLVGAMSSGSTFDREYTIEEFGWVQDGLLVLGLVLMPTCWWPLLATKTKESTCFFLASLVVVTVLIVLAPFLVNGLFWVMSGGTWDSSATDSGLGVAAFLVIFFIPALLISYFVVGLIIRKRSLR